jgi:hypothetical protein
LTFNKSGSLGCVLQTLFLDQEPDKFGNKSNRGSKFESAAVFQPWKYSKSGAVWADIDMLVCYVLELLLNNWSWTLHKSWSD